ncbi:hypothetical protein BN1200_540057 [Klebsiella variicola]|nr:hypothetical protein BN1200_540057 [Klebsiella variicola]
MLVLHPGNHDKFSLPLLAHSGRGTALYFALFCDVAGHDEQTIKAFWASIARFWVLGIVDRIIISKLTSCQVCWDMLLLTDSVKPMRWDFTAVSRCFRMKAASRDSVRCC